MKGGSVFKAALFIAGTAIGVSYFTVPILTGIAGFIPAVLMTILVWAFTFAVGLLFAEATLSQPPGANLATISRALLGNVWSVILSIIFFINMISYLASYVFYIDQFLVAFFHNSLHITLPPFVSTFLSTLPFFIILFIGLSFSLYANAILVLCLATSAFFTIYSGSTFVASAHLLENQWIYIFFSVPTLFSALGFVGIVPVLCTYLDRNPKKIRMSMWMGTLITLAVYLAWEWFMIGAIPLANFWVGFEEGAQINKVYDLVRNFPKVIYFLNFTLFFSMATSMIGNGLGALAFLFDFFKLPLEKRIGWRRLGLCLLIFLCTLLLFLMKGRYFLSLVQDFAAPVGAVLLNGIIPVWMVAQARYIHGLTAPVMLPGGRLSLMLLGLAIFILIYLEGIVFIRI